MPPCASDRVAAGTIRPAVPGDAARLAVIDRRASVVPRSEAGFRACCGGEGVERALVYEDAGEPAGFVVYARVLDEASIHNIAVDPDRQGRGIGRTLMLAVLDRMRQEGARTCLLDVRESNAAARSLYVGLGFRIDGRRRAYYPTAGGYEDALLMSLAL